MLVHKLCVSKKGGTGGGGCCHLQGDMHMVAVVAGCQRAMVWAGWANSHPGCMDRTQLSPCRGFISGKEGCLGSEQVYDN